MLTDDASDDEDILGRFVPTKANTLTIPLDEDGEDYLRELGISFDDKDGLPELEYPTDSGEMRFIHARLGNTKVD